MSTDKTAATTEDIIEGVDVQVEVEQEEASAADTTPSEIKVHTLDAQETESPRTLYRHPVDKMLGGVCGGLADFFGWDSTIVRLFFVVMMLATGGGGFLAYLTLCVLLPVGTTKQGEERSAALSLSERNLVRAAYVLIGMGVVWLLANIGVLGSIWGVLWSLTSLFFWPALLIGAGYLLLRRNRDWRHDFSGMRGRFKTGVDGVKANVDVKMPSGAEVRSGMQDAKQRIPLKRSRSNRMLMGVCGGLSELWGLDANLIRLIWAAFSIGSIGMGVLAYVLIGLLLPEEPVVDVATAAAEPQDVRIVDGTVNTAA